ncbi:MAG TPA: formimidoylglutamase [Burkholderiaceae bacterium]
MKEFPDMQLWHGRVDAAEGPLGQRWHQMVRPLSPLTPAGTTTLLGFACDAGVARNQGRAGARNGPAALRKMLANMPVHACKAIADAGDVICLPEKDTGLGEASNLEGAQEALAREVSVLLGRALFPLVLGGGHEMAYGSFTGLADHLAATYENAAPPRIGVINLDAHFDLRMSDRANSGTPFRQIAEQCKQRGWPFHYCALGISPYANTESLFERARQLGAVWRLDEEMGWAQMTEIRATLSHFLASVDHVYLTLCLDVLPASVMPGVSAPAPHGVALPIVEVVLDMITDSDKLCLADIAELNPAYDIDNQSARVAARLAARIANNLAA